MKTSRQACAALHGRETADDLPLSSMSSRAAVDAAHLLWTATAMSNRSPRVSSKPGTSRPEVAQHI